MKKKNGFTLVEIIIVVSIIGLLAGLGSLAIQKSMNIARKNTAAAELEVFSTAVLQLAWDTGKWPNGEFRNVGSTDVIRDISDSEAGLMEGSTNNVYGDDWKGPYYEGPLLDPWNNPYFFDPEYQHKDEDDTPRNAVVVGSCGPDGITTRSYIGDDIYILLDD